MLDELFSIPTSTPSLVGKGWREGKTTAPISDDTNLISGNRLKEYNGIEYTYDTLGNLTYRQLPNGENQYYQYDLENQLVRAEIKKTAKKHTTTKMEENLVQKRNNGNGAFSWKYYKDNVTEQHRI